MQVLFGIVTVMLREGIVQFFYMHDDYTERLIVHITSRYENPNLCGGPQKQNTFEEVNLNVKSCFVVMDS